MHKGDETHVLDESGSIVHVAKRDQSQAAPARRTLEPRYDDNAWYVGAATWSNSGTSPITWFNSTWTVPPLPDTDQGQIIFIFEWLTSAYEGVIASPQLQWGESAAGGGDYWTIASWYMTGSGNYISEPITVTPGTVSTSTKIIRVMFNSL